MHKTYSTVPPPILSFMYLQLIHVWLSLCRLFCHLPAANNMSYDMFVLDTQEDEDNSLFVLLNLIFNVTIHVLLH